MNLGRALRGAAMLLLGVAVLAWVAASGGGETHATSAASTEQGTASIEAGSTVLAVTSDRPRIFAKAKRGDGPWLLSADGTSVSAGLHAVFAPWVGGQFGPSPAVTPLALGLSRRGPPPAART